MRAEPAKRGRGRPAKPTPEKACARCGKAMARHRWDSGRLEPLAKFTKRRFCSATCMGAAQTEAALIARPVPQLVKAAAEADKALRLHGYERCERCDTLRPPAELEGHELTWKDGSTHTAKICKAEAWCVAAARREA